MTIERLWNVLKGKEVEGVGVDFLTLKKVKGKIGVYWIEGYCDELVSVKGVKSDENLNI